jgi:hypothetical protein
MPRDKLIAIFDKKKYQIFFSVYIFPIFGHQNPGSGSDPDRYLFSLKCRIRTQCIRIRNTGFWFRKTKLLIWTTWEKSSAHFNRCSKSFETNFESYCSNPVRINTTELRFHIRILRISLVRFKLSKNQFNFFAYYLPKLNLHQSLSTYITIFADIRWLVSSKYKINIHNQ